MTDTSPQTPLERTIPPEIRDDRFWRAIARVAATEGVRQILEIGSSSGAGSTAALVAGALRNPSGPPIIHCLEVSRPRVEALKERYREHEFVRPHHRSSVALERFPDAEELADFCRRTRLNFRRRGLRTQLRWLEQDVSYLREHGISEDGIRALKSELEIDHFDAVLIDGSEFTGKAELDDTYGARFLLLDDILTYKNYDNYRRLRRDPAYRLVEKSRWLRNGYAVFEQRS